MEQNNIITNSEDILVFGKIRTHALDDLLADTNQIWDLDLEEMLSEINKRIGTGDMKSLSSISRTNNERLYEVVYNNYSEQKAKNYFGNPDSNIPVTGCSSARYGSFYGRNLDWLFDESVEFLVRTPHTETTNAVIGISSIIPSLTQEVVEDLCNNLTYHKDMEVVPWALTDGINEHGLVCSANVVPLGDKFGSDYALPTGNVVDEIYTGMVVRYVLDNFSNKDEACNYLLEHVKINVSESIKRLGYSVHFMIADRNNDNVYIIEIIDNQLVILLTNPDMNVSTNFWLSGISRNDDGTVYSNKDVVDEHFPTTDNHITPHGSGLERYNLLIDGLIDVDSVDDMRNLMNSVMYTNTYKHTGRANAWFSEFVGGDITVDTAHNDPTLEAIMRGAREVFSDRSRDPESENYGTWQTVHSVVYNMNTKELDVITQEQEKDGQYVRHTYSLSQQNDYKLPIASNYILGGIKVGTGLTMDEDTGVLSASGTSVTIDSQLSSTSVNPVQNKVITAALNNKVDAISGKVLSDNNYTSTEKTKLANIVPEATKTWITQQGNGYYLSVSYGQSGNTIGTDSHPVYMAFNAVNATNAGNATYATSAQKDSDGNNISNTYLKKTDIQIDEDTIGKYLSITKLGTTLFLGSREFPIGSAIYSQRSSVAEKDSDGLIIKNTYSKLDETRDVVFRGFVQLNANRLTTTGLKNDQLATASSTVKGGVKVHENNMNSSKGVVIENDGTLNTSIYLDVDYDSTDIVTIQGFARDGITKLVTCDIEAATEENPGIMTPQNVSDISNALSAIYGIQRSSIPQLESQISGSSSQIKQSIFNSFNNLCEYLRGLGIQELSDIQCYQIGDQSGEVDFLHGGGNIIITNNSEGSVSIDGLDEQQNVHFDLTYSPSSFFQYVDTVTYDITQDAEWLNVLPSGETLDTKVEQEYTFSINSGYAPTPGSYTQCTILATAFNSDGDEIALGDTTINVYYNGGSLQSYTINGTASDCAVKGYGNYFEEDICELVATPDEGYEFTEWSDGNTENPRRFSVSQSETINCSCTSNVYTVSAIGENCTISGTGQYVKGEKCTLTVIPNLGYKFVKWEDGVKNNTRQFKVVQDVELQCICVKDSSPLCFTATQENTEISLSAIGSPHDITIEYSTDTINWNNYVFGETILLENIGDVVYFRNASEITTGFSMDGNNYYQFLMSKDVNIIGDISSLLNKNGGVIQLDYILHKYCFYGLFKDCVYLTSAPELNFVELSVACYRSMFENCTSLIVAPELPATSVEERCYNDMFAGCTSLTAAPELPATNLSLCDYCYYRMFYNCSSLVTAPELPATTLAFNCYMNMFEKCSSLLNVSDLPATTTYMFCYNGMFKDCTSLTTPPLILATTLSQSCCREMFSGCRNLTSAPDLLATTLTSSCYWKMFNGCTKLNSIKCLATDLSANYCTTEWLQGVSATGEFTKAENTLWVRGKSGIPTGWTVYEE